MQPALSQIFGRRRMHRMEVGVISNIVLLKCVDDISPPTFLEHARLFPHHLECRAHAPLCEHLTEPPRRIIIGRQQVILGIEPKDDIHPPRLCFRSILSCECDLAEK
jgi:hypothetical protein